MRQTPNNRRGRGRGNGRKPAGRHHTFDSNGPSVRVRGTAPQLHEKYLALARDASAAGDRIMAENYYQHADHYYRVLNVNSAEQSPDRSVQNPDRSAQRRGPADQDQEQSPDKGHDRAAANGRRAPQRRSNGKDEDGKDKVQPKTDGGEAGDVAAAPRGPAASESAPAEPKPAKRAKPAKPAKPAKAAKAEAVADQEDEPSTPDSDQAPA